MDVNDHELAERYATMGDDTLVALLRGGQLTETAARVARQVLVERGIDVDDAVASAAVVEAQPSAFDWSAVSKRLPRPWVSAVFIFVYCVAIVVAVAFEPEALEVDSTTTRIVGGTGWLIGVGYWLACIHRLHWILAEATANRYPITPERAAGFHLIPLVGLWWVFRWPATLGRLLDAAGMHTRIGGWLGVPCLLGFLVTRFFDSVIGLAILFLVSTWLIRTLRRLALAGVRAPAAG